MWSFLLELGFRINEWKKPLGKSKAINETIENFNHAGLDLIRKTKKDKGKS